jgi:crotonobetainyl-CoA:carnitine CoA-transferase CaiB-like acyl-CoA transferase
LQHGLRDLRVVDFSEGIAGAYASKLFADAGAEVMKVEAPGGDPLRRYSASGAPPHGRDGALFRFLHTSKRARTGAPGDTEVQRWIAAADLVVESGAREALDPEALCRAHPGLVVLSITPYGRGGPYARRPASEFTVQAESGSLATRGVPDRAPFAAGGRIGDWVGGTFAAVAALAAVRRAREHGFGEHVDFSLCEVVNIAGTMYSDLFHSLAGRPPLARPARSVELPSIEPTRDGWVGFNTNSRQQYEDFLLLIERPDLKADPELARPDARWRRMDEWNALVRAWTTQHTTAEVVERAALLRIPVAPVQDGRQVTEHPHFIARGVFVKNPDGDFVQPRPPYQMDGAGLRPLAPPPRLGADDALPAPPPRERRNPRPPPAAGSGAPLPLAGLRVLDATAWWAGPSATGMLAALGADVIHLESVSRPDGMRMAGGAFIEKPGWWERGALFLGANANKRGLTLDLADARGLALVKRLLARCDVFVENYSPRVVENFGLDWEAVRASNPRLVMVRMPAFGLDGPWRNHVGFAQTMEQISGLAWLTGHADDQPRIQRGPCDPLAGMHAAFAALVALFERDADGRGHVLECPMVEGALNAAAEQVVEYTATGHLMQREGNRAPWAAPQGLYACRGEEQWLALSVESDAQWAGLRAALGDPTWARDGALASHAGRRAHGDRLDAELARWASQQDLAGAVAALVAQGVPAAPMVDPRTAHTHPQLSARGFFERMQHPICGEHPVATLPLRFHGVERWLRTPAPTMGQHNHEILAELGLSAGEIAELETAGVIGTRPKGL